VSPQTKELRSLLEALAVNQNPTEASLNVLRRIARNAVDPGVYTDADDAVSGFVESTLKAGAHGSLSPVRLLELPEDEVVRIVHFRLWQHGAQLTRKARRQSRHQERGRHVDAEPEPTTDIEAEVRRQHDVPIVARALSEELGPDLLRLLRFRLQGFGFSAIAKQENLAPSSVHARVMTALAVLRDYANRTRTSEETGRLALLLLAS
jgi:hypothetical protein